MPAPCCKPIQIKALREGKAMSEALATKPLEGAALAALSKQATVPAAAAPVAATPPPAATAAPAPAKPAEQAALSPADTLKAAMQRGEKVYLSTCAVCHQPAGTGLPPTFPALKGSAIVKGPVAGHMNQVLNGKPGTAMQAFKDQLSDQDIADVVTYERNAWDNNTGTLVKPEDVKAARQDSTSKTTQGATP